MGTSGEKKKWLFLYLVSVLLILGVMGYGGYLVYVGVKAAVEAVGRRGYSLFSCLSDRACTRYFNEISSRGVRTDWVYYALPLVPLAALGRMKLNEKPRKAPGVSRFAKKEDVKSYLNGNSGWLGLYEGKPLSYPGDRRFSHTLVLGQPGAGKTSRFYEPNLLKDALEGNSVIIIDLKWPNPKGFPRFIPLFESTGHNIELFLPYENGTKRLPLLKYATDPLVAQELAEGVIPVDQKSTSMTYYKDQERAILSVLFRIEATSGSGSIGRLVRLLKQGYKEIEEYVKNLGDQRAKEEMGFFFELTQNQKTGLVTGLIGKLQPWDDPRLERATERGDVEDEIDIVKVAQEPTFLYIGIPQAQLMEGVGQVFLQMMVRYINRTLLRARESWKEGGGVPVIIYMDEWANLGYLPGMDVMLATVRERRIGYILTLQNLYQGIKDYGEAEFRAIINNLGHWVIFPQAISLDDRKYISDFLGETTAYEQVRTQGWKGAIPIFDPHLNVAEREVARLLLSPVEMNTFKEGEVLILGPGVYPMRVFLPRVDEPKINGWRNPLYPTGKFLGELRNYPDEVMANVEKYLHPRPLREDEQTPNMRFHEWVEAIVDGEYEVVLYRDPETLEITKVHVLRENLPEPLHTPPFLQEWIRQALVRVEKGEKAIAILPKGLDDLSSTLRKKLEKLGLAWKMVRWARENRNIVEGIGDKVDTAMAYFEEAYMFIPEATLRDIYGKELPRVRELLNPKEVTRKGVKGVKLPTVVEYMWGDKVKGTKENTTQPPGKERVLRRDKESTPSTEEGTEGKEPSPFDWLFD